MSAHPSVVDDVRAARPLFDKCGRMVRSLRISVTDRCNLRCTYCLPLGTEFRRADELLSWSDVVCVVRVACGLGVDHVRLTGGEPLVRPGLSDLVARLKEETGVREVALTTNGVLLDRHAVSLAKAGLDRLTVSVDSLRPERFRAITCRGSLADVWRGIQRASDAGLRPLKINVVVISGMNDDEIDAWADLTRDHDLVVRFLELMPVGEGAAPGLVQRYVNLTQVRRRLTAELGLVPTEGPRGNGPARYWRVPGARGVVGFITPISDGYCGTCSRFRLTAVGELRPCLGHDLGVPLRDAIQARDEATIAVGFARAAAMKPAGHRFAEGAVTKLRMSRIGG